MIVANFVCATIGGLNIYLNLIVILIFVGISLANWKLFSKPLLVYLLIIFWMLALLALINPITSVGVSNYVIIVLFVLLVSAFSHHKLQAKYWLTVLAYGIILASVRVLYENANVFMELSTANRIDVSFLGGVNNYSYLICILLIIAYYYFNKYAYYLLLILFVPLNLFTLSRGGNLAMSMFFVYTLLQGNRFVGVLKLTMIVGAIYQGLVFYGADILELIVKRYFSQHDNYSSGRDIIWGKAWDEMNSIRDYILGHGFGNFRYLYSDSVEVSVHNQYLDLFYSSGIVGSIIILIPYGYLLRRMMVMYSRNEPLIILNLCYLLSFLFDSRLWVIQSFWIYALIVGLSLRTTKELS